MPVEVDDLTLSGSPLRREEMSNDVDAEVKATSLRIKTVDDASCFHPVNCPNEQQSPSEVVQNEELNSSVLQTSSSSQSKTKSCSQNSRRSKKTRAGNTVTTRQPHTTSLHMNAHANALHEYSTACSTNPASGAGNREWHDHKHHTVSSDSGWISDSSWSSKEEDDDDSVLESSALNSLNDRLEDVLQLENRVSTSFSDNIYQENRLPSIGFQNLSRPTSDENEPSSTPKRGGSHGPRSIKAIPVRFLTLLRSAAEHTARQIMRLEGCPLMVQFRPQDSFSVCHSNGQLFIQPAYQTEFTGDMNPCASSWYIPGNYRYVQNQYQQSHKSYAQIQYNLVDESFMQGHYFVQSPGQQHSA